MKSTGVYATEAEFKKLTEMAEVAAKTPVIIFRTGETDWATEAWNRARKECHRIALSKGLPEIPGFYGIDKDGQFMKFEEGD